MQDVHPTSIFFWRGAIRRFISQYGGFDFSSGGFVAVGPHTARGHGFLLAVDARARELLRFLVDRLPWVRSRAMALLLRPLAVHLLQHSANGGLLGRCCPAHRTPRRSPQCHCQVGRTAPGPRGHPKRSRHRSCLPHDKPVSTG